MPLGTVTLDAAGTATLSTDTLPLGSRTINVDYGGTEDFLSSSAAYEQTVIERPTTTVLTSSLNPSIVGDAVTLTATATGGAGGGGADSVTFTDGVTTLGTVTLDASGTATLTTDALTEGDHAIVATYENPPGFAPSSAALTQVVEPAALTTTSTQPQPSTEPPTTATTTSTEPAAEPPTTAATPSTTTPPSENATASVGLDVVARFLARRPAAAFGRERSSPQSNVRPNCRSARRSPTAPVTWHSRGRSVPTRRSARIASSSARLQEAPRLRSR